MAVEQSRFAELTAELLGAKAVADLIREIWAAATPEVRQALADAVIEQFTRLIADQKDWTVRHIVEATIQAAATEIARDLVEQRKEVIARLVSERFEAAVEGSVHGAVMDALQAVKAEVGRKLGGR